MNPLNISENESLRNATHVDELQCKLLEALSKTAKLNHSGNIGLYSRLLMIISSLRELSVEYRRMVSCEEGRTELNDELQREVMEILGLV